MKQIYAHVSLCFLLFISSLCLSNYVIAQCSNNNLPIGNLITLTGSVSSTANCVSAGSYIRLAVNPNTLYTVSTVGGANWDTQLTVYNDINGNYIAYNDDAGSLQSTTDFTSSFSGVVRILLDRFACSSNASLCADIAITSTIINSPPNAVCQNITLPLTSAGSASIVATDVDNGSNDVSGIANFAVNNDTFDCSDVGDNTVVLTVTSTNGLTASCTAVVTVEDNIAPEAICQDITAGFSTNGTSTVNPNSINNGSNDACGIASLVLDNNTFTCADAGDNTVLLTVSDNNGNTSSCTATVNLATPIAITADPNTIVTYNGTTNNGNNNCVLRSSNDNLIEVTIPCDGIWNFEFTNATFDTYMFLGTNCCNGSIASNDDGGVGLLSRIMLPLTTGIYYVNVEAFGNSSIGTYTLSVGEVTIPIASCQTLPIVQLDADGNGVIAAADVDNGSNSNSDCNTIANLSLDNNTFTCNNVGDNNITLTVTSSNGNTASCTTTVTVEDNIAPEAICQDVTIELDDTGNASIVVADIDGGSTDACGIDDLVVDTSDFTCNNVGDNNATLTITDTNDNTSSCIAVVTVQDNIAPDAVCQNITVQLDITGNVSIAANDIDNGTNDACGIDELTIDISNFSCDNTGDNNVTLTVTDNNDNTSSCIAVVTVQDNIAPEAICQDVTIELDDTGNASIVAADIDEGSTDICGIADLTVDMTDFTCDNVATNVVILTVSDNSANTTDCIAVVMVEDNIAPDAICQDITVQLDITGNVFIAANDIDNGTNDACGIDELTVDITNFSCDSVGDNTVTLLATDENENTSSCTSTVTVEDNVAPNALCQIITVALDATGNANITANDIDNGSSDACGIDDMSIDTNNFTCDDVGNGFTTLTVTDNNGNTSSCLGIIVVEDNIVPQAICQYITVQLDEIGTASIVPSDVDHGSNDICGIDDLVIDISDFSCDNVGNNTVMLTVTDDNDNTSSCTAIVSVEDNIAPEAICQDITVELDENGITSIVATDVDGGSNDACNITSIVINNDVFDCANVGANTVVLTVTDNNDNTSSCEAVVMVQDNIEPSIVCPNNMLVCELFLTYPTAMANDNCVNTAITYSPSTPLELIPGVNIVTVTATDDANNMMDCTFEVAYYPLSIVTVVDSDYNGFGVSCTDNADGQATVTATGNAPFIYSWSNGQTTPTATNLVAGVHAVTVTDDTGCIEVKSVFISTPEPVRTTVTAESTSCVGTNDGSLMAISTGGTGNYTYAWSDDNGNMYAGEVIEELPPGTYTLTITDENNCSSVTTATVEEPEAISVLSNGTNSPESADGGISAEYYNTQIIEFGGGTYPYDFDWDVEGYVRYDIVYDEEIEMVTITVIYADNAEWSLLVTDANGCTDEALSFGNLVSNNETGGLLDIYDMTVMPDNGTGTGSISIAVSGGIPCDNGYNYNWNGPSNWLDVPEGATLTDLPSGWYAVEVTDCGPDGSADTGDEQVAVGWYWVPQQSRGRAKMEVELSAYPNPITTATTLAYTIPTNGNYQLNIVNVNGQVVANVFDGYKNEGYQQIQWQVPNLAAGVYFAQLNNDKGFVAQLQLLITN